MYQYYLKRILKSRIFYICILISAIVLIFGAYPVLLIARDTTIHMAMPMMECIDVTMGAGGIYGVIAPALMSTTFLLMYTEELEKRAVYYQMLRSNRKGYYRGQILSALSVTCLIIVISLIIFCVVCLLNGVAWGDTGVFTKFEGSNIEKYFLGDNAWKMTIWFLVLIVMYCLPWPLVGMVVSLITKNRYIILASPFVIYMAWNYITQLIYSKWHNVLWISPRQPLLRQGLPWESYWSIELTILYPIVYHIIFIGGLSFVYMLVTRRRFYREGI